MKSPHLQKTFLVTGASSGIGLATVLQLARSGQRVFAGVRNLSACEQIFQDQGRTRQNLIPVQLDVTDPASLTSAMEIIERTVGESGLDGLVNNAGIPMSSPVEFLDLAAYRRLLEVNVCGAIAVTQRCLELLRTATGRIVNISSVSGYDAAPFLGPYASSKYALEAISDALRVELSIWKIKVIVIEPGDVATPMWKKFGEELLAYNQGLPKRAWELYGPVFELAKDMQPRGLSPEVVAGVVEKALLTAHPKTRYRMGADATVVRLLHAMPTSFRDWVLRHRLP